jgi:ABC-type uncharacterized transport system substrate-binding protein
MKLVTLLSAAALLASPLMGGDYDAIGKALRHAMPNCGTVAVVCDSAHSKSAVDAIAGGMSGMNVIVVDVKGPQEVGRAISTLGNRHPDVIILVAGDKIAGDGTSAASFLIQRMASAKVPTMSITEQGVRQGAALGVGPSTGGKVLANAKMASATGVAIPAGASQI